MTTRELFEAEFPVPSEVAWGDGGYVNRCPDVLIALCYNDKWIGFQAGVKAKEKKDA